MNKKQLYDNCFYVEQKKYGLWSSTDTKGKGIITSLTEEECIRTTRWYLKQKQESAFDSVGVKTYTSITDEKL